MLRFSRLTPVLRFFTPVLAVAVLGALQLQADDGPPPPPPPELPPPKPVERIGLPWWTVDPGLAKSAEKRHALLLVYGGSRAESLWPELEVSFSGSTTKKRLAKLVAVEVPCPAPKAAREILGGLADETVVALCDFRGTVLKRWDGKAPSRGSLRKYLKASLIRNAELASRFARADDLLAKARYALKTKKYPEAVRHYLATEKLRLPAKSEPVAARAKLRAEMDEIIEKRRAKAKKLEDKEDLASAIGAYEKIMTDFPLPELKRELRKRVSELWNKMRGYGG